MRFHKYSSLEEYKAIQICRNKHRIRCVSCERSTIELIATYIKKKLTSLKFGICHGTRRGLEQAWFRDLLNIEVIGTEISDTGLDFAHTIVWDFHEIKEEWLGAVDFIYSNSLDHSHSPRACVQTWMECLRPGGLLFVEWSEWAHGDKHVTVSDCFGASLNEMRGFLPVSDEIVLGSDHVVFVIKKG